MNRIEFELSALESAIVRLSWFGHIYKIMAWITLLYTVAYGSTIDYTLYFLAIISLLFLDLVLFSKEVKMRNIYSSYLGKSAVATTFSFYQFANLMCIAIIFTINLFKNV